MTELQGKRIVITGGTTGIGRATAKKLVEAGADVLIFGRDQKTLDEALDEMEGHAHGLVADASKPEQIARVFAEADITLGGVDILINNAALKADGVLDMKLDDLKYVLDTNLLGYIVCCREAVERMRRQGDGGHVVMVGSMSAEIKNPDSSLYVATKSAIRGLSASLRKELDKEHIRVSLVEPGAVGTDMNEKPANEQEKAEQNLEMLTAEDIADCVHFCLVQPPRSAIVALQVRPQLQSI